MTVLTCQQYDHGLRRRHGTELELCIVLHGSRHVALPTDVPIELCICSLQAFWTTWLEKAQKRSDRMSKSFITALALNMHSICRFSTHWGMYFGIYYNLQNNHSCQSSLTMPYAITLIQRVRRNSTTTETTCCNTVHLVCHSAHGQRYSLSEDASSQHNQPPPFRIVKLKRIMRKKGHKGWDLV